MSFLPFFVSRRRSVGYIFFLLLASESGGGEGKKRRGLDGYGVTNRAATPLLEEGGREVISLPEPQTELTLSNRAKGGGGGGECWVRFGEKKGGCRYLAKPKKDETQGDLRRHRIGSEDRGKERKRGGDRGVYLYVHGYYMIILWGASFMHSTVHTPTYPVPSACLVLDRKYKCTGRKHLLHVFKENMKKTNEKHKLHFATCISYTVRNDSHE